MDDAWRIESIQVKLQTDGHSCGVWQLVVERAFLAYCDSSAFGKGGFGKFLTGWLARRGRGVVDLNSVRGSGATRGDVVRGNEAFIKKERDELRARLLAAARALKLPYTDAALDEFVAEGATAASASDLDALDDEYED